MLTHRNLYTLWLLLLPQVSGVTLFMRPSDLQYTTVQNGDVRLFGSKSPSEGRVEIYYDGRWGTVCDDGWDMAEARVVCRQLEFSGAKSVVIGKDYGQASGPIWMDDVNCRGTEKSLSSCSFKGWGQSDCSHKEDVGVVCESADSNTTIDESTHEVDHSTSLSDDLGQIFDNEIGCDFHILVQSATGNRKEDGSQEMGETKICVNKMILSKFPLFNATCDRSNVTVRISRSCQPYFTSFIRYIYTRKIDVTVTSAQCIHWLASEFGLEQLKEDAGCLFTKILPEDPSFQTQLSLYKYAEETKDLVLQDNCAQYLAWNYENLTTSPVWSTFPEKLLGVILARSDLVVEDEYALLQSVESWIEERGDSITLETKVGLLSRIRFPMITAEKVYGLEVNSSLYSTFTDLYQEKMLKAFQFNLFHISKLRSIPSFNQDDDDYKPRIYTSEAWSRAISPVHQQSQQRQRGYDYYDHRYNLYQYNQGRLSTSFVTPVLNSLLFKDKRISWEAYVYRNQHECSNQGLRCTSFPVGRLTGYYSQQSTILFRNRLLLMCQGRYICQIQDFKDNMAYVQNKTENAYPCPDDQYTYRFVVRPEYI